MSINYKKGQWLEDKINKNIYEIVEFYEVSNNTFIKLRLVFDTKTKAKPEYWSAHTIHSSQVSKLFNDSKALQILYSNMKRD